MDKIHFLPVKTPSDFKAVEALAYPIWREHYTPIIGAAQVEYMLQQRQTAKAVEDQVKQGGLYFLIKNENGERAGFFSVIFRPDELFLSKLYLLKSQRGKGLARKAMEFLKDLAREKGNPLITLTVHKRNPSVKVYESLGFRILGPVVTDIGGGYVMDDYQMGLNI